MTSSSTNRIQITALVNTKRESSDEPEHPSASFAQSQAAGTQHPPQPGSQVGMFSEQMTSHVRHMTPPIAHQDQDDIRYQLPRKQIENAVSQPSMYIQPMPDHMSTHSQVHSNIHMPSEGHNQSHPNATSNLHPSPNYPYYYPPPQYHHHNMHGNVPQRQQQQPMQIYAPPQPHPNYPAPPTAPHLRYPQLPQNSSLYAVPSYSMPDVDQQHPAMHPYYQYQAPESNVAPHLQHNPVKLEPEIKSEYKTEVPQHMQQPYKKIATPRTPPTSVSPTLTKRKRAHVKDESNSSRADGEEDGNASVDQALTDDSDSAEAGPQGALSSDDSYEERRRKKKRRKLAPAKPKEQGNVVPEKYQLPDPGLIEQTKAILKEYSISQKVLAHQLPASETMVSLWMNGSKKLIGWQDLEAKVRDWLKQDHQRPEKQHTVNFIDETTRVKQRLDGFK